MEKKIKLVMDENKSIAIFVNDALKYTIAESVREISAQAIYELINYKSGDNLSIFTENKKRIDEPVLLFFKELFDDICKRINEMDVNEEDTVLKTEVNNNSQ
jgi:hypothetical protein